MKLQKSSVARRVVETKNLGVAEGRRWEEREVIVGGVACERGRGGERGGERGWEREERKKAQLTAPPTRKVFVARLLPSLLFFSAIVVTRKEFWQVQISGKFYVTT